MTTKDIVINVNAEDNFTRAAVSEIIEGAMGKHFRNVSNNVVLEEEVTQEEGATLFDALVSSRGLEEVSNTPVYIEESIEDEVEENPNEEQAED